MSNINTVNINGNFPIAGQDNNSQTFRDNFTSIKNNLAIAGTEIDELQNKAILKSSLSNGLSLNNDFGYTEVKNMQLSGHAEKIFDNGQDYGPVTISYALGNVHKLHITATSTITFDDFPDTPSEVVGNLLCRLKLIVKVTNPAHILKLASVTTKVYGYTIGSTPAGVGTPATVDITFPNAGANTEYVLDFSIINSSTPVIFLERIDLVDNIFATPFGANSTETLTQGVSGTAVSLNRHATVFITNNGNNPYAVTLGAGQEGQIKVLALKTRGTANPNTDPNDVRITVTNGAWGTNPTKIITLNEKGQAVTLQYLGGNWYCIGNTSGNNTGGAQFTSDT